ncbi:ABC transporter ATP-binding protein [Adlercreutzia caecimuris]|uniref:ABC transporter ATP-binding protein n=1 Tax=Adlercreutzia caecimuris TaxID=671266 RepID=UPI00272C71AA|nr:ABC transporter ATP-binding protein [Adlercreutzia caecimuris]
MEKLMELTGVVKEFSSSPVVRPLDGLDLTVRSGRMVAVTGVSGKGKSTLLNVMGGLLRPESGEVRYRGIDLARASAAQLDAVHRRGIGFVFQTPYLLQALTAYENLELALKMTGEKIARDRIFALLEELGLGDRAQHLPSALSAGQKRRLVLGRALLASHDLLLADEPTNDLDDTWSAKVFSLLRDFCVGEERSVVLVTHDRTYASQADEVYVLENGILHGEEAT